MNSKTVLYLFSCLLGVVLTAGEIPEINLSNYIRSRYKAGERDIVLPDGKIKCRTVTIGKDYKDLTIRGGKNTVLISTRLTPVFYLNGCKNVTLRDFALDYDPLAFTQGSITRLDRENKRIYYRLHDGYPRLSKPYLVRHPLFFDPKTRKLIYGEKGMIVTKNVQLSPDDGYLQLKTDIYTVKVGDMLVLNFRNDCALKVRGMAENLQFINITMYSGPGGIIARRVKGQHIVRNCRAIRGERPAGAAEERLFSLSADAVNYATGRKGPIIEGNEFEFIGDDSVNLHGRSFKVVKAEPEKGAFIMATGGKGIEIYNELIFPGDRVRMLAKNNFAIVNEAKVKKLELFTGEIEGINLKKLYPANPPKTYSAMRVYVDGNYLPEPDMTVDFPAINMPGFIIRNNYFHDHRARGMRIMAASGIIENNRIERLEHQAISAGASYGFWTEAGWVENIVIRNNVIDSVCIGSSAYRKVAYSPGAICTFVHNEFGHFPYFPGNRGVAVENNKINNCAIAGIHAMASDGMIIRNNVISNVDWGDTSVYGELFGIKYVKGAIGTVYSKNAVVENNVIK